MRNSYDVDAVIDNPHSLVAYLSVFSLHGCKLAPVSPFLWRGIRIALEFACNSYVYVAVRLPSLSVFVKHSCLALCLRLYLEMKQVEQVAVVSHELFDVAQM